MSNRVLLLLLLISFNGHPGSLGAQEASGTSLTVTPSVGLAMIPDNGHLASGGMTTLVEIELNRARWRWGVFGGVRGIGVGCSDGCDMGGQAVGAAVSYLFGGVAVGGGLGGLHRSAEWQVQPHIQLAVERRIFRVQLRLELPQRTDDAHFPVLVGLRLPVG